MDEVKIYTKDDFLNGSAPYDEVYKLIDDRFELSKAIERMADIAKKTGVSNFKTLFKSYCQKMKKVNQADIIDNASNFDGQPFEINTGKWVADDYGITTITPFGMEVIACVHPIMPVERLVNVDTNIVKLRIAYRLSNEWRTSVIDKKVLASANSIIALSDLGIAVTSENAKYLVGYLHDAEYLNYDIIPEKKSVSRLGWIPNEGFSPYMENLIFDGEASFKYYFEAVTDEGDYKTWLSAMHRIRKNGPIPRILLAASFASVLVEKLGCLPFFVHLWGGTETGKTVGLLLAASVWANPDMGQYVHTFNSTAVAQELSAGFVNSMPLMLDELQLEKDRKSFDKLIYQLSEGVGRMRGAKTGGIQKTPTWRNCIISTGEQPLISGSSGGGAINRAIEINCEDQKLFDDPQGLMKVLRTNYGFAGKMFVEKLKNNGNIEIAKEMFEAINKDLMQTSTEKQSMAAALILTADTLSNQWIFNDEYFLTAADIEQFLMSKDDVDQNKHAYEWLKGWIAQNAIKFSNSNEFCSEVWGKRTASSIAIIKNVFDEKCQEAGYNPASFLSWLKRNRKIKTSDKRRTCSVRINGNSCRCVILNDFNMYDDDFDD